MFTRVVALLVGVGLVGFGGVWFAVSSDRWPGDNRDWVAGTVFSLNKAAGRWLLAHGEPNPCVPIDAATEQPLQPQREPLTAAEIAEATTAYEKELQSTGRERLRVGQANIRPGPLGPSVNVSVGGGGSLGSTLGVASSLGSCFTGSSRRG